MGSVRIIGAGRAGSALGLALGAAGWEVHGPLGRVEELATAAEDVELVVIATPDAVISTVAQQVRPVGGTVVAHLAGSLGPGVLAPHADVAAIHPLITIPEPALGAARLRSGAWFAVAATTPLAEQVVGEVLGSLGGRPIEVSDQDRVPYHAAACIASNHLVALLGQVERVAAAAGVPLAAYLDLVRMTVENVESLGPAAALTGPVARGDEVTVRRHLEALEPEERPAYEALAELARRLLTEPRRGGSP